MIEYFHGYHWKHGKEIKGKIDESVWLENEKRPYNPNDFRVYLYFLIDEKQDGIYKIGISRNPHNRCDSINEDVQFFLKGRHRFIVVKKFFIGERETAKAIEKVLLDFTINNQVYKKSIFGGATELRYGTDKEIMKLIKIVEKLLKKIK